MDIYSLVAWLKWILVGVTALLSIFAINAWRRIQPKRDYLEGSYEDRMAARPRGSRTTIRFAGLWGLPILLTAVLQWVIGWDSLYGRLNLLAGLGMVLVLAIALVQVLSDRRSDGRPEAPGVARRRLALLAGAALIVTLVTVMSAWRRPSYAPHMVDLRRFDPEGVARLETAMWRSYYDKQPWALFLQLRELMAVQYRFPRLASFQEAYLATRAAFVFKGGKERPDYEKALPYLESYYREIQQISTQTFDPHRLAVLELEWWIVHRQENRYSVDDLSTACADLMAAMYRVSRERVMEHGRLRAEAMKIRDRKSQAGGVTNQDWAYIESLLRRAYRSLYEAVQEPNS